MRLRTVVKWVVLTPIILLGSLLALVIVLGLSGVLDRPTVVTSHSPQDPVPTPPQAAAAPPAAPTPAAPRPPAAPAAGAQKFVDPSRPIYIVSESGRGRPIMASREAMDRAQKLIADGISQQRPDLLRELIVCMVKDGTRVSLLDRAGMFYRRVMVAEGPSVGCEGVVAIDWLTNAGRSQPTP